MTTTRKMTRAFIVKDDKTGAHSVVKADTSGSKQLKETIDGLYNESKIQRPPYEFDQLAELLTRSTPHLRSCKQKASDVAGRGWDLIPEEELDSSAEHVAAERDRLKDALDAMGGEMTMRELLEAVAFDFEWVGWGFVELVLDGSDNLTEINHLPGHTVRAHADGNRYVQVRGNEKVWFLSAGASGVFDEDHDRKWVDAETGDLEDEEPDDPGNLVIPFINYTPLSSWYGLPDYIPSVGAMASNVAIRDYNLQFISRNLIPQYAVLIQGADMSEELEETILEYFRDHVAAGSQSTLVVPIPFADNEVTVKFERLAVEAGEGGFLNLRDANTVEVLMGHGVPPYRVAWAIMGSLGGNLGNEMNEVYKDAIVEPRQETIEHRFNRYIIKGALQAQYHTWKLADIDLTDQHAELGIAKDAVRYGLMTPKEARVEVLGREAGDAPDVFYIDSTLVRVDEPTPTPEETEAAQFKRLRADARKALLNLQDEMAEAVSELKQARGR